MMNKNAKKIVLVAVLIVAILAVTLGVYFGIRANTLETPVPEFVADKGIVNWDAVSNAGGYRVILDDKAESIVIEPTFQLPERGKHTLKISSVPAETDRKHRESAVVVFEVLYTTTIAVPDVEITRHKDGNVKYVINNFDKAASKYVITVNDQRFEVTEDRGILETKLADGEYKVVVFGIGDNVMTTDSQSLSTKVTIAPVTVHQATYETSDQKNDFVTELAYTGKEVDHVVADLYKLDASEYVFDTNSGTFKLSENVLLRHEGDAPAVIEVHFADGNVEIVEVTITDNRVVRLDEYLSINAGSTEAKLDFSIYRNELVSIELVKNDASRQALVDGKEYTIEKRGLVATLYIKGINKDTDSSLVFTFKKGDETYKLTVKYYFRTVAPEVYTTHATFNKADKTSGNITIFFDQAAVLTGVKLPYANADEDYIVENKLGTIVVNKAYLDDFDGGAVISGEALFGKESSPFTIHVIDVDAKNFHLASLTANTKGESGEYTYKLGDNADVEIMTDNNYSLNGVSFDSMILSDAMYNHKGNKTTISYTYLEHIGAGRHEVRLHVYDTTTYDIVTHINIDVVDITPSEVDYTIDNSYPNITFRYKYVGDDVTTTLTNTRSGKTFKAEKGKNYIEAHYLEFVKGDKYTITHERGGESKTSEAFEYQPQNIENLEKYYNAHFTFGGEQYDAVMTSKKELETFTHYAIMRVSKMRSYDDAKVRVVTDEHDTMLWTKQSSGAYEYAVNIYTPFMKSDDKSYTNDVKDYLDVYIKTYKEPNSVSFKVTANTTKPNECTIYFKVSSTSVPYSVDNVDHKVEPYYYKVPYETTMKRKTAVGTDDSTFGIYEWEKTQSVFLADEIYFAIEDGARPVPVPGSPAEAMLEVIMNVNRQIIDKNMTDTEKYIAIYEWIISNVTYDENTAKYSHQNGAYPAIYGRRCFFLEGVFIDHVAVCDGLSKAVVVMAGLEGIHSMRVLGYANGQSFSDKGDRHAWVKVRLNGAWYNSDPTWGSQKRGDLPTMGGLKPESANHLHTLVSDTKFNMALGTIGGFAHKGDKQYNVVMGNIDFDYFANIITGRTKGAVNTLHIKNDADIVKAVDRLGDLLLSQMIVAIPVTGSVDEMNSKFVTAIRRKTGSDTWIADTPKEVKNEKNGKAYRLFIFTRTA